MTILFRGAGGTCLDGPHDTQFRAFVAVKHCSRNQGLQVVEDTLVLPV